MRTLIALTLLAAPWVAGSAWAQNTYLSAYGGGGSNYLSAYGGGGGSGDYRNALSAYQGGGSRYGYSGNGYTGANAGKYSHYRGGMGSYNNANWGWANALRSTQLPAPCGNFQRAAARCRNTTMAWDPTFQAQRGW